MSRNALIIIVILVLIGYGATILSTGLASPPVLKPEVKYTEPMGLSVRSLGEEISVPNETALIEKLEQFAEEDPMCYVATWVNFQKYRDTGALITMKYQTPVNLTWVLDWNIEGMNTEIHHINVRQITAALSYDRESYPDDWLIVYSDADYQYPLEIPREQADELLELIGKKPVKTTQK